MRLDKFLQVSRLVKRRTMAHTLCEAGRVRVNGATAKPSASIKPGDVITLSRGDRRLVAKVLTVPDRSTSSKEFVEILGRIDIGVWGTRDRGNAPSVAGRARDS